MSQTNGNGQLPDPTFAGLEDALRAPVAEVAERAADQRETGEFEYHLDPQNAAGNARDAVHFCAVAAAHIREIYGARLSAAQRLAEIGEALAVDYENRARMFAQAVENEIEDVKRSLAVFADERAKLVV